MICLIANSAHLPPNELSQKKESLRSKHQSELVEFDALSKKLIEATEADLLPQIEVEQVNARLQLKGKQLNELADAMNTYTPGELLVKQYQEVSYHIIIITCIFFNMAGCLIRGSADGL